VIDTVGAGDSFQAALLTALAERDCLDGAAISALPREQIAGLLRFATQAAAITCSRRGADLPRRSELID
jgi:fructokinase